MSVIYESNEPTRGQQNVSHALYEGGVSEYLTKLFDRTKLNRTQRAEINKSAWGAYNTEIDNDGGARAAHDEALKTVNELVEKYEVINKAKREANIKTAVASLLMYILLVMALAIVKAPTLRLIAILAIAIVFLYYYGFAVAKDTRHSFKQQLIPLMIVLITLLVAVIVSNKIGLL